MLTAHAIKIYSRCNKFEVFKTKKVMKRKNCTMNDWAKKIKFNTLFILCINLCNVYQECIKIINAQQAKYTIY